MYNKNASLQFPTAIVLHRRQLVNITICRDFPENIQLSIVDSRHDTRYNDDDDDDDSTAAAGHRVKLVIWH